MSVKAGLTGDEDVFEWYDVSNFGALMIKIKFIYEHYISLEKCLNEYKNPFIYLSQFFHVHLNKILKLKN
jgi:hypothetical protein